MIPGNLKKWLALGTGIGIEIRGGRLIVTAVRVRPSGVRILASTTIERFRDRPADEWGAEYATFLKKIEGTHLTASVLLPRDEVILRQLTFPGVADRDLDAAIRLQVDSLHPYPEDEDYGLAGDLDLWATASEPIFIVGAGRDLTKIDARGRTRVLDVWDGDVFVEGLTLFNGKTDLEGGCLRVTGNLTLRDVVVRHCTAVEGGGGIVSDVRAGALQNGGDLLGVHKVLCAAQGQQSHAGVI